MTLNKNDLERLMELTRTATVAEAQVLTHPHLYDYVSAACQEAKAKAVPGIHISASPLPFASSQNGKITLSEGLFKAMGMESQFSPLTAEMKATLAHEITHHTESSLAKTFRLVPIFAAPLVAMAALDLYQRHAKHAATAQETIENIHNAKSEQSQDGKDTILQAAKYLAVATVGTAAGLYFTGKYSKHLEFKADRGALKLTGDKDAIIRALEKSANYTERLMAEMKELQSKLTEGKTQEVSENIIAYVRKPWEWAKDQLHAHPTSAQRGERLASL